MLDTIVASAKERELIAFRIAEQEFCVDIMAVREIRGWAPVTPLPHSPSFLRGVLNLRGAVLPIVDLAARLGLPATNPTARHVIIVAQVNGQVIGLLVDAVSDILTIGDGSIQPPPEVASGRVRTFVQGLVAIEGRMVSFISLDRVLPRPEAEAA
ncbi:chemotaxis protein CheW [Acidisphaera sp. L21]|jgi:purine-binding chemotaxis protein CheW|uniref:chemotaxis protein CheW n=1 Tax=Acidisphaera sp. L21 TaxID=1641851 RepID=UPI00131B0727|nr:chemotaxis protein CheW [Acidisphaera sp. L21]